jgi:lipopolysaccharide export system protein LptA
MRLVFLLVLFSASVLCFAQDKTEIRSVCIEIEDRDDCMFFSFIGSVVVASDGFELSSNRLDATLSKCDESLQSGDYRSSLEWLHAFGDVKFVRGDKSGSANEVIFNVVNGVMILSGSATITDPNGTVHGDMLILNRGFNSGEAGQRARRRSNEELESCNHRVNFANFKFDE